MFAIIRPQKQPHHKNKRFRSQQKRIDGHLLAITLWPQQSALVLDPEIRENNTDDEDNAVRHEKTDGERVTFPNSIHIIHVDEYEQSGAHGHDDVERGDGPKVPIPDRGEEEDKDEEEFNARPADVVHVGEDGPGEDKRVGYRRGRLVRVQA